MFTWALKHFGLVLFSGHNQVPVSLFEPVGEFAVQKNKTANIHIKEQEHR